MNTLKKIGDYLKSFAKKTLPVIRKTWEIIVDKLTEVWNKIVDVCKNVLPQKRGRKPATKKSVSATVKGKTAAKKKEQKITYQFIAVAGMIVAALLFISIYRWTTEFSYTKCLDETLFLYEGKEVELREITYYIMIEEEAVNKSAQEYDPQNVNSYWNLHLNESYVSEKAKETALNYCVRDILYAYKASEIGMELSESVVNDLRQKAANIYEGLTEKQLDLGLTEEDIYQALYNNQLADDWVLMMAKQEGRTLTEKVLSAYYGINSYFFKKTKAELDFVLNDKLWDEVHLGSMTIN